MPPHPLGILPEGHILMDGGDMTMRNAGLGNLHGLSDALLLEICGHLDARTLSLLSCASKACYCFCATEDLWKAHVLEEFQGNFTWNNAQRTWRAAYTASREAAGVQGQSDAERHHLAVDLLGSSSKRRRANIAQPQDAQGPGAKRRKETSGDSDAQGSCGKGRKMTGSKGGGKSARRRVGSEGDDADGEPRVVGGLCVRGFYSDLLYQPWHCATAELQPEWLEVSNVDRKHSLSPAAFREQYELKNKPVVLTDGAARWPAMKKWSMEYLEDAFSGKPIIAGNFPMPFTTYSAYAHSTIDEMPLYLFDKEFVDKAPKLAKDFTVPSVFSEDLFSVLGSSRPDYRWLIVGPARSGSSFHVDPNCTSAWNAVVQGTKKWILFPPGVVPPGVHPSPDGADVATPVSVMEWFLNFYAAAREAKVPPLECVVKAGEVIFVPRGWWHACLNLETMTIAVTQNYVSSANVSDVLRFIRPGRSDLVSGCALDERANLYEHFLAALRHQRQDVVQMVEQEEEAKRARKKQESKLSSLFMAAKGAAAVHSNKHEGSGSAGTEEPAKKPGQPPGGTFCFNFDLAS